MCLITIYEIYEKSPKSLDHKLFTKNGKLITYAQAFYPDELYENAYTVVDKKNGYIYILDEGTGAGSSGCQFILFRKKDHTPLIAMTKTFYDSMEAAHSYDTRFWEQTSDHQWKLTSFPIWQNIAIESFLPKNFTPKDFKYLTTNLQPKIYFKLPRSGLTAEAQLQFPPELNPKTCQNGLSEYTLIRQETLDFFCQKVDKKVDRIIKIKWNKQIDDFEIVEKSKAIPQTTLESL